MLATLERIDPQSDRIDVLVALVEQLRPRRAREGEMAAVRVRMLTQLLKGDPAQAAALRAYLTRLLHTRRHTSLYTDIGILSNDGFFTELKSRIAFRFLPPALGDAYLSDAIDQVLYRGDDHEWINAVPTADWLALFDVIAGAQAPAGMEPGCAARPTLLGMLDAIRTLSCRVCALGLEPRLIRSHAEIENFDSPFLMQNIEVNDYLDGYARLLAGEDSQAEDARHLLVMLDQCDAVVGKIRKNALNDGTSVALTYLLVALTQSIDRLRKLLFLVDVSGELPAAPTVDLATLAMEATAPSEPPTSLRRAAAVALARELAEAHSTKYTVHDLVAGSGLGQGP
jgi:site-specific recombinase